jgi:hypothetical protein
MYAAALLREPDHRRYSGQGFTLAGLHFGDIPALQCQRAQELHIEHAQAKHAFRNHSRERKRLRHSGFPATAQLIVRKPRQFVPQPRNSQQPILRLTISKTQKLQKSS